MVTAEFTEEELHVIQSCVRITYGWIWDQGLRNRNMDKIAQIESYLETLIYENSVRKQ